MAREAIKGGMVVACGADLDCVDLEAALEYMLDCWRESAVRWVTLGRRNGDLSWRNEGYYSEAGW